MEGAKELSMLYFNHANKHISLGLKGRISKRNGLISVYSYYPFVEIFKVIQIHMKAFSVQHYIVSLMLESTTLKITKKYSVVGQTQKHRRSGPGTCNGNKLKTKSLGYQLCQNVF